MTVGQSGAEPRGLLRHVLPLRPPPGWLRLHLGAVPVGWVRPAVASLLRARGLLAPAEAPRLADAAALSDAVALLAAEGLFRPRGERFAVRADGTGPDATGPDDPNGAAPPPPGVASTRAAVLAAVDRAALPVLGLWAHNAHLNGLVGVAGPDAPARAVEPTDRIRDADPTDPTRAVEPDGPTPGTEAGAAAPRAAGTRLWVATRAAHKELGPGLLDHLVAGGIPHGLDARATLLKEAAEEAGLSAALAARAVPARSLRYALERPEGLRREVLHCFDLALPDGFAPVPVDGEVAGFALWPLARVHAALRDTEGFLFDAALAVTDLLLRRGVVPPGEAGPLAAALAAREVAG